MTESQLQPGDFVHYTHLGEPGIGKVKEAGHRPLVEFWSGKVERKDASGLTPVADIEPVALLWDNPAGLAPWAKEKPLKLVALAMSVDGGKGKPASIKEKLDGKEKPGGKKKAEGEDKEKQNSRVPLGADWKNWWTKRNTSLNALSALPEPQHFTKSAKGNEYTLLCPVEKTPDDVTAPVSLANWEAWLLSDMDLPTFGKNPSKVFCDSLSEWPGDTIERALNRLLWGAEVLLSLPKRPSATAALSWMDAVGRAALRWADLYPGSYRLDKAKWSGDVLAGLSQHIQVKEKRKESTLFRASLLSERPDRQRQIMLQQQEYKRQRTNYERQVNQEQERQRTEYERRLEQQRLERERERANYERQMEQQRLELDSERQDLERERRERERLEERVRIFSAQMASGRKESRLEVRQGMLLAVGDALQRAYIQGKSAEDRLSNVITTLPKALQEGDAETLGTVGATVKFDQKFHHSPERIPIGVKVRLTAPGVVVGERVILKASVSSETEVC